MKVVTFNIRCDYGQDGKNSFINRKQLIVDKIRKDSPDLIGFQEVLPHVAATLKEELPDYYLLGHGREADYSGEQTSVAFRKDAFDLKEMKSFWLSQEPDKPGTRYKEQSNCPRTCTCLTLYSNETKQLFRIYNTHLDHEGSIAREKGLRQILNQIAKDTESLQLPLILMGDFNAIPGTQELTPFKDYPELTDLTSGLTGTFHEYGALQIPEKIDYILTNRLFTCKNAGLWTDQKDGIYLSDHYPVFAELDFNF